MALSLRVLALLAALTAGAAHAQDLRAVHRAAAASLVYVVVPGGSGSGFIAEVGGTRVVVTCEHVVGAANGRPYEVQYYDGTRDTATVAWVSRHVDLALLVPAHEGLTPPALPLAGRDPVRGERVVLAGHPALMQSGHEHGVLRFATSEGVVAGAVSEHDVPGASLQCGEGHNCVLLDAQSDRGSSGGPVLDVHGSVLGMLWGGSDGTSFSIALHAATLHDELVDATTALAPRPAAVTDVPPRFGPASRRRR